jgi:hypothetical protein
MIFTKISEYPITFWVPFIYGYVIECSLAYTITLNLNYNYILIFHYLYELSFMRLVSSLNVGPDGYLYTYPLQRGNL